MNDHRKKFPLVFAAVLAGISILDIFCWSRVIFDKPPSAARVSFLDVGQGDSELAVFPGGITMMTDAGPTNAVLAGLERALPGKHYIDVALITHPQLDHFGGYDFILDHYGVGAFLYNGRGDPGVAEWSAFKKKVTEKHIPLITIGGGDNIRIGADQVDILSPNGEFAESAELNDTGLVEMVRTKNFKALFVADTGFVIEDWLVANVSNLTADVLKIAHHGSKYASGEKFLRAVDPAVAVIEVGAKNVYGHPSAATLARLTSFTHANVFRTDQNGTVTISGENGKLNVAREK